MAICQLHYSGQRLPGRHALAARQAAASVPHAWSQPAAASLPAAAPLRMPPAGTRPVPGDEGLPAYIEHIAPALGHVDRHAGLLAYCRGLLLPLPRKTMDVLAQALDPQRAGALHQSLHHFVSKSGWSDAAVLRRVAQWVLPRMDMRAGGYWVLQQTALVPEGQNPAAAGPQRRAVSVSLAGADGSLPVSWQRYLPHAWATDAQQRRKAAVPAGQAFATPVRMALNQLAALRAEGAPAWCVVADAGLGTEPTLRDGLAALGLPYVVESDAGVRASVDGAAPAPLRDIARALAPRAWRTLCWQDGDGTEYSGRFAAVRVRMARSRRAPEAAQWLLVEWPARQSAPLRYMLSTLPEHASLVDLVAAINTGRRAARDLQAMRRDFGLGDYEGRSWRGFVHHATLATVAYGWRMAQRLQQRC
ncbi:IS701 family transposase [Ramlibacter sp. H39-3-26]|uniref:IS701 family transposase n=1 Tax=Curvibacter soli TaxID=3031331 RepID=UPI0023DBB5A7|nr:IS701 family transposase [Ramlibacter sp. H39-3-26]MDF1483875.1 IS701 family transposase [Ramlibacter sp. H39-3-26]